MLYTIEHFLPTIPITLDSGMGRPQIEKLISYRQFCEECWKRCQDYWEAHVDDLGEGEQWAAQVVDGDFAQSWHDEMAQLDHEGQTEFRWNIVEDRLKGMLNEQTGLHFNVIDMSWKNWFTVRKYAKAATEEERADIWTTVDSELERLRHPQERHLYPPMEDPKPARQDGSAPPSPKQKLASGGTSQDTDAASNRQIGIESDLDQDDLTFEEGQSNLSPESTPKPSERGVPSAGGVDESAQLKAMRAQLEQLEQRNAELEAQSSQVATASYSEDDGEDLSGLLDTDGMLQERAPHPTRSPEEQETLIDDLTLSRYEETEGHRKLRHWQAQEHGEEAIDFEAAALKSVPLMSGGPVSPITDLWHIPAWRRNARDLRMQIGEAVTALANWSGIEISGDSDTAIRLNAREGFGYELNSLNDNPSRPAQLVWQLLAGLQGDTIDPMLPADISLLGELVGSHGMPDTRLPDGLFIRVFWLMRLIRVLRDIDEETPSEGDSQ